MRSCNRRTPEAEEKHGKLQPSGGSSGDEEAQGPAAALGTAMETQDLTVLGYKPELHRNRSMFTLLFQSLSIAAIPYGFGGPMISAVYGGGQLPMFLGWIVVLVADECVALSLGEFASKYPTSAGPYYWSFQLASPTVRTVLSFVTGCVWLIGNWTVTLSVNFGCASMIAASGALYYQEWSPEPWKLLLIFYAICLLTFFLVAFGNRLLPMIDTACAAFTAVTILVTLICLSVKAKAGRHSVADTLGYYDTSLSGWGRFSFFIGMLPAAYTFCAVGMITSMAEECGDPRTKLPKAISLCVPVGGIAGLFFLIPICATLPPLQDILAAPIHQSLPYVFGVVMGSPGGGLALTFFVLIVALCCSISVTVAASRCTWAFARDRALPLSRLWSKVDLGHGTPILALTLITAVQMLLGLIYIGSSSAFLAFVSVSVVSLALSYGIPIAISLVHLRRDVNDASWTMGSMVGWVVNIIALVWITFETVLFSMPTALPVTVVSMNYASVVLCGFMAMSAVWYAAHARKVYKGPPVSDGLLVPP